MTRDVLTNGIAVLAAASTDDDGPYRVNGVAIGEGDTTRGMSGKPTYYGADVLREAVDLLIGVPIVRDHPGVSKVDGVLRVDPQPPVESILGDVTDAMYRDGVGLLWQGEIDDPEIARQVERGRVAVSPILGRDLDQWSDEKEAYLADRITGFRDLGVVARGASPSASIEPFSAETIAERFSFEEIKENFDGEPAEALTVEPVSGGSSGGSGGEGGVDALSRDEKEDLEVLQERKRLFSNRGLDNVVSQIDGEIEALVGTDGESKGGEA